MSVRGICSLMINLSSGKPVYQTSLTAAIVTNLVMSALVLSLLCEHTLVQCVAQYNS